MKKRILSLAAALVLCLTACAGNGFSDNELLSRGVERSKDTSVTCNYADGVTEPPSAYNNFSGAAVELGLKLLRRTYSEGSDTAVMPADSMLQLSLLANGAKGDTRTEILFALGSDLNVDSLNACCSYFQSRMQTVGRQYLAQQEGKNDPSPTLTIPRALFLEKETEVRKTFLQANADYYGADILRTNFADASLQSKLDSLLIGEKPQLTEADGMVSYAALSFSDTWLNPYSAGSSPDGVLLHSEESYMESDKAKGVIKYTTANPLKALFILPDGDFDEYIKRFDSVEYFKLLDSVDVTKRQGVQLHPFTGKASAADMKDALAAAGLSALFTEKSDFGNLAHGEGLTLDSFWESVPSVTVSAAGITTGTQATPDSLTQDIAPEESEYTDDLVFDKPFLFILTDNESNIPLYITTVHI